MKTSLLSLPALLLLLAPMGCTAGDSGSPGGSGGSVGQGTGGGSGPDGATGGAVGTGGSVGSGGVNTGGAAPASGGSSGQSGGAAGQVGGGSGGSANTGGSGTAGRGSSGGASGSAGRGGTGGTSGGAGRAGTGGAAGASGVHPDFSFFVVSLGAVRALSGNQDGFGGDLRYGETGTGAGLRGGDKICAAAAERAWPGTGAKAWRAFLSTTAGGANGGPVHARDRVGSGPWRDALGRLVASNLTQLLMDRPGDADTAIKNDLPNEYGVPNHSDGAPGCTNTCPDNHDILTGTGADGMLYMNSQATTCNDWTSSATNGSPRCGHSWPRTQSGTNWMSSLPELGCAPAINLSEGASGPTRGVGSGGGYGGIYCFVTNAP